MSYHGRRWMVSHQDDGMLSAMNGWYYICDQDGGILLGYFKDKEVADDICDDLNKHGEHQERRRYEIQDNKN